MGGVIVIMVGGSRIEAESLASPKIEVLCMQSINMFSTYGKLHLNFITVPTSKNTELVRSLYGTCWEFVGNRLAGSFSIVTRLIVFHVGINQRPPSIQLSTASYSPFQHFAGSRRVLTTVNDDWSENLFALAPVRAYAYVR